MSDVLTLFRATILVFLFACVALNEQNVTTEVQTIRVMIERFAALMARCDNLVRDAFSKAFIEHKVHSFELNVEVICSGITSVFNDSTFEVIDIFEALVLHVSRSFFTTNSASAIHEHLLVFVVLKNVFNDLKFFAEGVYIRTDSAFEMPHFTLVVIAHVYNYCVRVGKLFIPILSI